MADAVFGAAGEIWAIIMGALTNPGPYLAAGLVLVAVAAGIMGRGKLAAMIWMPALALAGYFAWRHFVR
jgi:hypothetical protein